MSRSDGVLYPPGEILNPIMGKTDFEYVILWMLSNNDICEWSDFTAEISESTLSGNLNKLMSKGYIKKPEKGKYVITSQGQDRYTELVYFKESGETLLYPPKAILKTRNYDHWILWMLCNNPSCKWSDFKQTPLSINQSSLSNTLNSLLNDGFIARENKEYVKTQLGEIEYFRILKSYDLDRQTILEQESKRIEEITEKTSIFFKKYKIEDDELKFRYLDNILKLSYSKIESMLREEEDFNKVLLYFSINHPDHYPEFISVEKFSKRYNIDIKTLDFLIMRIVDNEFFGIKFFKLEDEQGGTYYFQKNEIVEKILNAIVEKHITKFTYLNKFHETTTTDVGWLLEIILNDICSNLFNEHLKPSLKSFLPEYIKYLAYKIETEKKLVDIEAKLAGFIWRNVNEGFQAFDPSDMPITGEEDELYYTMDSSTFNVLDIVVLSKFFYLNTSEVQETYSLNKIDIYNKIIKNLYRNKVSKARELSQNITTKIKTINQLIMKDIIATAENNFNNSIKITNGIIDKYPNEFIGYLLQSITYLLMDNYEKSLEIIENALKVTPNVLLICQKAQILMRTSQGANALDYINDALSQYPDNSSLLKTKYLIYITYWMALVKDYNEPLDIINQLTNLNQKDQEILLLKSLYYCLINKYKEAKRLIINEIDFNNFKKNPRIDTIAYFILVYSYLARGKFDKALEIANLVLTIYPEHPTSFFTKALVIGYNLIYRFTFKDPNIDAFTELITSTLSFEKINYNKTIYLLFQSQVLNGLGKYDESINSIDTAIEIVPTLNYLYARKAYLLITSKKESQALSLINELLESRQPLKYSLLKQKSYVQIVLKQYDEGLKTVNEAIELYPHDNDFINNKAMILGYLGRREEAIETAEHLISLNPKCGNSYDTYGEVLMALKEYEKAIEKFKEALTLEPTGWFAYETCLKMGQCFKELGNIEKALEYYEKGEKLTEKMHPSYRNNYLEKTEKLISEAKILLRESKNSE